MSSPEFSDRGIGKVGSFLQRRVISGVNIGERVIDVGVSNLNSQIRRLKEEVHEEIPFIPLDPKNSTDNQLKYELRKRKLIAKGIVRENVEVVRRINFKSLVKDVKRAVKDRR